MYSKLLYSHQFYNRRSKYFIIIKSSYAITFILF
jgi:hypothetical protein